LHPDRHRELRNSRWRTALVSDSGSRFAAAGGMQNAAQRPRSYCEEHERGARSRYRAQCALRAARRHAGGDRALRRGLRRDEAVDGTRSSTQYQKIRAGIFRRFLFQEQDMSLRRIQIPPALVAKGKYLFEETNTLRKDIAAMMGISSDTLRRRSIEWGWKERPRLSAVRASRPAGGTPGRFAARQHHAGSAGDPAAAARRRAVALRIMAMLED